VRLALREQPPDKKLHSSPNGLFGLRADFVGENLLEHDKGVN